MRSGGPCFDDQGDPGRSDRAGRGARRFLTPLQTEEILRGLVRQEVRAIEAAEQGTGDRRLVVGIRTLAQDGARQVLATSRPGRRVRQRDRECEPARLDAARLDEALPQMAVTLMLVEGRPRRGACPAASRAAWMQGQPACAPASSSTTQLTAGGVSLGHLGASSAIRCVPIARRSTGKPAKARSAPPAATGGTVLAHDEVPALLPAPGTGVSSTALLAGSRTGARPRARSGSPPSLPRFRAAHGLVLHPPRRPGHSTRKPFPDSVGYRPARIKVSDHRHVPRCDPAVIHLEDLGPQDVGPAHPASSPPRGPRTCSRASGPPPWRGSASSTSSHGARTDWIDLASNGPTRSIPLAVSHDRAQRTSGSAQSFRAAVRDRPAGRPARHAG